MGGDRRTSRVEDVPAERFTDWLRGRPDHAYVLDLLGDLRQDYYLVGGVVRDFLRGAPVSACGDLDVLVPWESADVLPALKALPAHGETRFGNPRFRLPGGTQLDVFHPASARSRVDSAEEAVEYLDFTVNAVAFSPVRRRALVPEYAISDLRDRLLRPLEPAWALADPVEEAHLLARLVRLHRKLGFSLTGTARVAAALDRVRTGPEVDLREHGVRDLRHLVRAVREVLATAG